jgi:hypothetical protein
MCWNANLKELDEAQGLSLVHSFLRKKEETI